MAFLPRKFHQMGQEGKRRQVPRTTTTPVLRSRRHWATTTTTEVAAAVRVVLVVVHSAAAVQEDLGKNRSRPQIQAQGRLLVRRLSVMHRDHLLILLLQWQWRGL
jgi:hypothetical protein